MLEQSLSEGWIAAAHSDCMTYYKFGYLGVVEEPRKNFKFNIKELHKNIVLIRPNCTSEILLITNQICIALEQD